MSLRSCEFQDAIHAAANSLALSFRVLLMQIARQLFNELRLIRARQGNVFALHLHKAFFNLLKLVPVDDKRSLNFNELFGRKILFCVFREL